MNIKIFTAPHCPHCKKTKKFLELRNVPFSEVNVMEDKAGYNEMVEKTHQSGVPVVELEHSMLVGHDAKVLAKMLNL
ncbi:MAG: glutaredoxin domain-containing protein [bacterium]|nr:glutaredoxin domain-containing protein [bacterium]